MAHRPFSSIRGTLCLSVCFISLALSSPAWSGDPDLQASESFDEFARSWMGSVQELGVEGIPVVMIDEDTAVDRNGPRDRSGVVTFREYGDEFTTELRTTGREATPYVGLLHYTESVYNCRESDPRNCSDIATAPVTEIFRYEEGRWVY